MIEFFKYDYSYTYTKGKIGVNSLPGYLNKASIICVVAFGEVSAQKNGEQKNIKLYRVSYGIGLSKALFLYLDETQIENLIN